MAKIDSVYEEAHIEAQPVEEEVEVELAAVDKPAEVEELPAKENQPVVVQSPQAEQFETVEQAEESKQ